ncbi:MAG: alkaline phosphatase family protein [Ignavibacteriales bacterium]|jgi:Metalloenzyme superfamily.|nr:MAG: metalloenzyme [Ignavibacteriaceae bacterium]MBW7871898.1 alkaline phosphatase family protein [Ignavibacteria bacterium]MCZ2144252.1 alkaline phosphatase family protein [Ignavibacteriales bacterium]OQY69616.1 MAG: hypothetical protein B6D45_12480 [Ignavibacteriales bacterium UTCHB3]MBV6446205.1 hypothetical protein [Ignavibacteriaceae bacterium]
MTKTKEKNEKKCNGSVILLFVDGVGIGEPYKEKNPFFSHPFKIFSDVFPEAPHHGNVPLQCEQGVLFPVDAAHGFPGFPQSGTGQMSIFGGFDAIKAFGGHFGPYAPISIVDKIYETNVFKDALAAGYSFNFLNAYPRPFFTYLRKKPKRLNVTAHCVLSSGIGFNKAAQVHKKQAVSAEITNQRWRDKIGLLVPLITPEDAANILLRKAKTADLLVYEYFLTDYAGHRRYDGNLEELYDTIDRFLLHIFKNFNSEQDTILLCSDHGNFEDISVKTHTMNPSMFIALGKHADKAPKEIKDLKSIKKFVFKILKENEIS